MKLTLNGQPHELPGAYGEEPTVAALIDHLELTGRPVAVEVNRQLVPKRQHAEQTVREGDVVEVVTLVGGG